MGVSGLNAEGVRGALYDLERLGIASNDTALTAFVHSGVERSSRRRLEEAEVAGKGTDRAPARESAPDLGKGDEIECCTCASLPKPCGIEGVPDPLPERLWRILRSIAADGRGEGGGAGSLGLRQRDAETVQVALQREWSGARGDRRAPARRGVAPARALCSPVCPPVLRGTDLLAETTLGKLLERTHLRSPGEEPGQKTRAPARPRPVMAPRTGSAPPPQGAWRYSAPP